MEATLPKPGVALQLADDIRGVLRGGGGEDKEITVVDVEQACKLSEIQD